MSSAKLLLQVIPNSTNHPKPLPLLVPLSSSLADITKSACSKLKLKYMKAKPRSPGSLLYRLNGSVVENIQEVQHGEVIIVASKGEAMKDMRLSKQELKKVKSLGGMVGGDENPLVDESEDASVNTADSTSRSTLTGRSLSRLPFGVSEIIPQLLFVGSARDASHRDTISQFTHVINVASGEFSAPTKLYHELGVKVIEFAMWDTLEEDLHQWIDRVFQTLDQIRSEHGRVLLHCVSGKSRSVSLALAYMLHPKSGSNIHSLFDAYHHVRAARSVMRPNARFIADLMELECMHFEKTASTLKWSHIASGRDYDENFDFSEWLSREFLPRNYGANARVTHEICDLTNRTELHVPEWRYDEFLSVYAREVQWCQQRGQLSIKEYPLKVTECYSHPEYRLNVEVRIPNGTKLLTSPKETIAKISQRIIGAARSVSQTLRGNVVVEQGHSTLNSNSALHFRLVWTESRVRGNLQNAIMKALQNEFVSVEPTVEIFHGEPSLHNGQFKMYMIYSMRTQLCEVCGGSGNVDTRQKKSTNDHKAKKEVKKSRGNPCSTCEGSGVEGIVFDCVGEYNIDEGMWSEGEQLDVEEDFHSSTHLRIMERLENASVWVRNEGDHAV